MAAKNRNLFHLGPTKMARIHAGIAKRRLERAAATVFPISDPEVAHDYLREHPVRGYQDTSFLDTIWFAYVKVDPKTRRVEDEAARNTETEVWIETGPGLTVLDDMSGATGIHDYKLDCGGPTFDAALVKLANLVHATYGDDASKA